MAQKWNPHWMGRLCFYFPSGFICEPENSLAVGNVMGGDLETLLCSPRSPSISALCPWGLLSFLQHLSPLSVICLLSWGVCTNCFVSSIYSLISLLLASHSSSALSSSYLPHGTLCCPPSAKSHALNSHVTLVNTSSFKFPVHLFSVVHYCATHRSFEMSSRRITQKVLTLELLFWSNVTGALILWILSLSST